MKSSLWIVVVDGRVELMLSLPCACASGSKLSLCGDCYEASVLVEELVEEVTE